MGTVLLFGFLAFLYKFSPPENKWWVGSVIFMYILIKCGYDFGMISFIAWYVLAKVLKDLCGK